MPNSGEILTHISAPGSAKDDARYRAHAAAYFEFEPVSRIRIYPDPPSSETGTDDVAESPHQVRDTSPQGESRAPRISELDERGQKTLHDISTAVSSAKSTPVPSTWGPSFGETTCGLLALSEASIQRSLSQNDVGAGVENSFVTTSNSPPRVPGIGPPNVHAAIPSSQVTETPPSEVPESQSSFQASWNVEKDNSPPRKLEKVIQIGRSSLDTQISQAKRRRLSASPACIPSSISTTATPISSISEPSAPSHLPPQPEPCRPLDKSAAAAAAAASAAPAVPLEWLSSLPLEINPPRPVPSSTAQFTTHITPTLQMLADRVKLSRVFNPQRQTRPLRTLERGYWLLNLTISDAPTSTSTKDNHKNTSNVAQSQSCNPTRANKSWTSKRFFDFWGFLSKFIADDGRAGWGVWCICESNSPASSSQCLSSHSHSVIDLTSQTSTQSSAKTQSSQQKAGLDAAQHVTVKIYSWGEIAPHVYLLMYLASDRSVRKITGVQWRDGADEPVIFMD
ncbi:conserved hypothetical protein [Histoplasma capsulatum var. duboisii H88]|uniref:Uncharacterized protein n=1 Tax=Ajellomyces capsulatus (strain H88) TaxID=544711 RepID=F0U742_AJEC8|nr:conserved hypothetical protein [Histoplasma capsulatum var. duboisii H88]QSS52844.1 hypothetical protein I7I53_08596 [Histoplasma capsulatum var. duboisii H88]